MGGLKATFGRAVAAHRDAQTQLTAARSALDEATMHQPGHDSARISADTVHRLRALGEVLATGWLGVDSGAAAFAAQPSNDPHLAEGPLPMLDIGADPVGVVP